MPDEACENAALLFSDFSHVLHCPGNP